MNQDIPAIKCSLEGGYLIEASAGTGKTWTLTGIILRLLIEKKYAPERIIATTFTKSAAAEMQERLQFRLTTFYQYIHWLQQQKERYPHWFYQDKKSDEFIQEIKERANAENIAEYDDPINLHLIHHLLTNHEVKALDFAVRHTSLLMATLDKLFVGTLDSLAQKWLREFSSEISYHTDTKIINNSEVLTRALIHDELRKEHSFISTHLPKLYQNINPNLFSDIESVFKIVELSLQFYHAPIDEIEQVGESFFEEMDEFIKVFLSQDMSGFVPYYDIEYAKSCGLKANSFIVKKLGLLQNILQKIQERGGDFFNHLSDDEEKLIKSFKDIANKDLFRVKHEEQLAVFHQLPIAYLNKLSQMQERLDRLKRDYPTFLYRKIALEVRKKLKQQLENNHQSTFTFELVRLIEALTAHTGLARHIRYLYPVALIDESQDVNGLQLALIDSIYLSALADDIKKDRKKQGFLLLVGDPKQAIYGFRGGDVSNYNRVKGYQVSFEAKQECLLAQELKLSINRRSNSQLIHALNQWFYDNKKVGHHNHANLGKGIFYQHITAHKEEQSLSWQAMDNDKLPTYLSNKALTVLHFNKNSEIKTNKFYAVAHHINSILQNKYEICIDGTTREILPTDIAVLARSKKELDGIKKELHQLKIPAVSPKEVHIFTTQAAKDLYHLFLAVMDSHHHQKLTLLLTSVLFNLSLEDSMMMIEQTKEEYLSLMRYFNRARLRFYKYGVISMFAYCLADNPLKKTSKQQAKTLWEQIAKQGERYMADIWQLMELIGVKESENDIHEVHFRAWFETMMQGDDKSEIYHQLPLPSETGVTLMTIHKSKGLEFPIVYVFGLDSQVQEKKDNHFYSYSDDNLNRRISPVKHKVFSDNFYADYQIKEEIDELKRLGYVALTRASEQVFVVANDLSKNINIHSRPLFLWLESADSTLTLPERLSGEVGWINMNQSHKFSENTYQYKVTQEQRMAYLSWQAIFKKTRFYGATTTSATALIAQLNQNTQSNKSGHDEIELPLIHHLGHNNNISYIENDIRVNFEKGTEAGIFLHKLLQMIDPSQESMIGFYIDKAIRLTGFAKNFSSQQQDDLPDDNQNHECLIGWIKQIIHTPMLSSVSLSQLNQKNHHREMGFSLGMGEGFSIEKINDIFHHYGNKSIVLNEDNKEQYYKYLNGEIDLIYEHQGKFYIVDYKSNFISHDLSEYHWDNLEKVMNQSGYWLQACIYQVALHRLLKLRIKEYQGNETNYLGGVEFIFLRGVDKDNPALGHIHWLIPIKMVIALDELFGQHQPTGSK